MRVLPQLTLKTPFFYGWVIVAVCFLADFGATLQGSYALTVMMVPMTAELGWSRTVIIGANFVGSIIAALISPILGRVVDRFGVRTTMTLSGLICGLTIVETAFVRDIRSFYLIYGVINGLGRPLTQSLGVSVAVANWFYKQRPRATAIVSIGPPIAGIVGIPLTQLIVSQAGWRPAWIVLGVLIIVTISVPAAIFMRQKPEDIGLIADGNVIVPSASGSEWETAHRSSGWWGRYQTAKSWDAEDAIRTRAFWVLAVAPPIIALTGPTFATHVVAFWLDKGISPASAAAAASSFVLGTFAARFFWGALSSRLHIQYCYVLMGANAFIGTFAILIAPNIATAFAASVFYGITAGGQGQLRLQLWPDYFGRKAIATLRGYSAPFELIGMALGPLFAAWIHDNTGSYNPALAIYLVLGIVSTLAFLFLGKPPTLANTGKAAEKERAEEPK